MKSILFFFAIVPFVFSNAQAQYFLVFKAIPAGEKGSTAGHAFVSFVKKDEVLHQTLIEHTWGFHPVNKSTKALFSTEGEVESTGIGDLGTSDFVVEVDEITYQYCQKLNDKWNARKYGIFANQNCVDYIKEIAKLVHPELKIPGEVIESAGRIGASILFPRPFLDQLRALNSKRDAESRISLSKVPENNEHQEELALYSNVLPSKNETKLTNNSTPQSKLPVQKATNLLGATNPEALGILLLNALKNNDKSTWARCFHPSSQEYIKQFEANFDRIRRDLYDDGLTDWKQVQSSRVTYSRWNDEARILLGDVAIEFHYKKDEFIGAVRIGGFATVSKTSDKYYVTGIKNSGLLSRNNFR